MEFVNLAKLYDWAKIDRYAITTGKFKDAGAEYQPLTSEQRALFQDLLNDVLAQFKAAIVEGRNMKPEVLDQYADGRVFTGSQAVKLGFADSVGTWDDARRTLGQMTGLGAQVSPHFQAGPKASEKAVFWRRSSSYRSMSGRSLASGMLGMRS